MERASSKRVRSRSFKELNNLVRCIFSLTCPKWTLRSRTAKSRD
jgi:hypothetical protein